MSILHAIESASMDTVEVGGLCFRVKKIKSSDLARVGFAALAVATPAAAPSDDTEEADPMDMLRNITPKQAESLADLQDATVCAGTVAVKDGEDEDAAFEGLSLVIDAKRANADKGTLWVGSLPAGCIESLFAKIMELSTDKGEAAERLRRFRGGGSKHPTGRSSRGKKLREVAT